MEAKRYDVILKTELYAYVLAPEFYGRACDYCFKLSGDMVKCTKCLIARYCDEECRKSAEKDHKDECANLVRVRPLVPDLQTRLIARIIYKLVREPDASDTFAGVTYRFQDLTSHKEKIQNDPTIMADFTKVMKEINDFVRAEDVPAKDELLEIYGKMRASSFDLGQRSYFDVGNGIGLCLGTSMVGHSCVPNVYLHEDGPEISVQAREYISQLNTSTIFLPFTNLMATTEERQRKIKSTRFVDCECSRCKDPENRLIEKSIICPDKNCKRPVLMKEGSFVCLGCGVVEFGGDKRNEVEVVIKNCEEALKVVDALKSIRKYAEIYEILRFCVSQAAPTLHLINIVYSKILHEAAAACINLGRKDLAVQYLRLENTSIEYYYSDHYHPVVLNHKALMGRLFMESITN